MAVVDKCSEANFSLTGDDEAECIDGNEVFKYLGRLLYRLYYDYPEVLQNTRKVRQEWERLWKIIWEEGVEQAVMEQRLEGVCVGFLQQVTK